ncbi:MAG: NAD-dependent epimerase/dehydratase family protein [Candidatus Eisenbacteria bacterium]
MKHRVFVTGATGYLGSAIAARLVKAGHTLFGLTRDAERARGLASHGIEPVLGDLAESDGFLHQMKNCDAVVHAAVEYGPQQPARDQQALEAIQHAVVDGRVRTVIYTSGIWVHGDTGGRVVDESSPLEPAALVSWRPAHEEVAMDLAAHGAAAVVLRPGIVYGGSRGILGGWFHEAREKRTITYPGGDQHWSMVHVDDVAAAYLLALEHAAHGARYLLVDETHFTARELAVAAAAATGAVARAMPAEEAIATLGDYGRALLLDEQATSARARRELGWTPMHTSFVGEAAAIYTEWQAGQGTKVG